MIGLNEIMECVLSSSKEKTLDRLIKLRNYINTQVHSHAATEAYAPYERENEVFRKILGRQKNDSRPTKK